MAFSVCILYTCYSPFIHLLYTCYSPVIHLLFTVISQLFYTRFTVVIVMRLFAAVFGLGLKVYADALEEEFNLPEVYDHVSRADFWILCSFVAIEEGHKRAGITIKLQVHQCSILINPRETRMYIFPFLRYFIFRKR